MQRSSRPHLSYAPQPVAIGGIFGLVVEMDCDTSCQVESVRKGFAHIPTYNCKLKLITIYLTDSIGINLSNFSQLDLKFKDLLL